MMRRIALFGLLVLSMTACRFQDIQINVTFDSLAGLLQDDRVIFEGNPAGEVRAVRYGPNGKYTVQLSIQKGFAHAVTQYSQFDIVDDPGQSGHKAIRILLSQPGGTPLKSGVTVAGTPPQKDFDTRLQEQLQAGFRFFREQIEKFGRDVQQFPESEEYRQLKKSLEDLAVEIEKKEKQAREKVKRDWLPRIQRELENLRKELKQLGREQELQPLEKEVEKIRRI